MIKNYCHILLSFILIATLSSCQSEEKPPESEAVQPETTDRTPSKAQQIIDQAIVAHGAAKVANSRIEFDFRGRHYVSNREGGVFTYERIFTDTSSGEKIRDVLNNNGFFREVDGRRVDLSARDSAAYANSVNSVIYFALLPYYLNDPAVEKEYLGETTIKGESYHEVKITFRQEGGGKDFQDEFIYWIHRERHTMDYLAYNYDTDETGARFREAYNIRTVGGIRFADYINYKPKEETMKVATFDDLYGQNQLEELSRIELENVEVYSN